MLKLASTIQQRREKTELVLANIYNLPPIPKAMTEAMELLENSSASISTLTSVISRDQGLVTKILTIANSPLYGLQRKVTSIDFAVMVLGFTELKNIISVLSMAESFKNKTDKYLDQKEFWLHSYLTGSAAKRLSEDLDFPNSGEAFVAGFLHDMGITVMHKYFHTHFIEIHKLVSESNVGFLEAEYEVLGMNHQEIGHFLAEKWNFPEILCDVILTHHNPNTSSLNKVLSSIVHLADYMTQKLKIGNSYWDEKLELNLSEVEFLRFRDPEELDRFIKGYEELFAYQAKAVRFLN
jgi:HD-like signal output (HDOD) protein